MSYVSTRFPLPSVTDSRGRVTPFNFSPARCGVVMKRGVRSKGRTATIRRSTSRARLTIVPRGGPHYMGGFWDSLVNTATGVVKGIAAGAAGGPAGMFVGGASGGIGGAISGSGKKVGANDQLAQQQALLQQQVSSPLAGISTGTIAIVGGFMAFGALVIALSRGGR
jgi:hypothetical protein